MENKFNSFNYLKLYFFCSTMIPHIDIHSTKGSVSKTQTNLSFTCSSHFNFLLRVILLNPWLDNRPMSYTKKNTNFIILKFYLLVIKPINNKWAWGMVPERIWSWAVKHVKPLQATPGLRTGVGQEWSVAQGYGIVGTWINTFILRSL